MLRKLTKLITPAPKKAPESAPAPPPPPPPPADLSATLKPILRRLTSAPSLGAPQAQEALAELKQFGLKRGLYVTAFEIRTQLDMMPRTDNEGVHHQKEWGYVLAGDFFYAHINREVQAARTKSLAVGPNIFKGYCDEMVECIIRSGSAPRAIEIPVLILDDLVAAAVDFPDKSDAFLELALQTVISAATIVTHYYDLQRGEVAAKSSSGARSGAPTPLPRGFTTSFDEAMLAYIMDLQQKLREIRSRAAQLPGATPGRPLDNPLERDQALLALANTAQYLPLCGIVKERIAALLLAAQPAKAATFFRSAGDSYEAQGDVEHEIHFTKLPCKRYQKACEFYTKARDNQRAARARAKFEKLQALRRPQP